MIGNSRISHISSPTQFIVDNIMCQNQMHEEHSQLLIDIILLKCGNFSQQRKIKHFNVHLTRVIVRAVYKFTKKQI